MKTRRKILAVLLALVFALGTFPLASYAGGDIPMDGDWETVAITSDTLDLSGGSETRPAEDFYAVVNTLLGLSYIGQITRIEAKDGEYFDLDKDGYILNTGRIVRGPRCSTT